MVAPEATGEWTTIQSSSKTKRKQRKPSSKQQKRILEQLALQEDDNEENEEVVRERVMSQLHECIAALESNAYMTRVLLPVIRDSASNHNESSMYDIVCYGIGNFAKLSTRSSTRGTTSASAPMLQLACALLLRKTFTELIATIPEGARDSLKEDATKKKGLNENEDKTNCESPSSTAGPKLFYYEPLLLPVERSVLLKENVHIISTNEQGKRKIEKNTFFFMPHCPMRLYSNVLWANWNQHLFDSSQQGRILIFGNSFQLYDQRIVISQRASTDSDKTSLDTNCVLKVVPYTREQGRVAGSKDWKRLLDANNHKDDVLLSNLESAFNDCVVMSFSTNEKDDESSSISSRPWEYRPDEHISGEKIKDGYGESELL
eukprot:scaffold11322_cov45-Attheya_sp.AAC.2